MPGRLPLAFVLTLAFTSTRAAAAEATPPVDELYQTARRHHQAGEYRRAATLFAEVVTRAPDGRLAVYAAELLFDSLSLLGAIDELGGWVACLQTEARFARLRKKLPLLPRLAYQIDRRAAEARLHAGDPEGCARAYEALDARDPRAAAADEVLYNAAVCWDQAERPDEARRVLQLLVKRYPKSRLAEKARERLAR